MDIIIIKNKTQRIHHIMLIIKITLLNLFINQIKNQDYKLVYIIAPKR